MRDHGAGARQVDHVDAAVVVRARVRVPRRARAARLAVDDRAAAAAIHSIVVVVGLDRCPRAPSTPSPCWPTSPARPSRASSGPGPPNSRQRVERVPASRVDVMRILSMTSLAVQLPGSNCRSARSGSTPARSSRREAGVDQVGELGGADAVRVRVVAAAHRRVAVGREDEVAGLDDVLARHLVADARRDGRRGSRSSRARRVWRW